MVAPLIDSSTKKQQYDKLLFVTDVKNKWNLSKTYSAFWAVTNLLCLEVTQQTDSMYSE